VRWRTEVYEIEVIEEKGRKRRGFLKPQRMPGGRKKR
jgi:hypothetical protein